ncbi:MAG TPA: chromate transporter [candidate division Zixibacteria bacterium]|nr:chromate transporter [candidate division Zixibacteria bacterium]
MEAAPAALPPEPLGRLFLRYLRFGLLAWGGPVAQIGLIRQELVEEKRWVAPDHFNRVLAVYQVLPGPEAHEMCVYFGMLSRGRLGGVLAGLGFMLPGFIFMLALSIVYVGGITSPLVQAFFLGVQPAVVALVVRAVHRIGGHALRDPWLAGLAVAAGLAHLGGTTFWLTLPLSGAVYLLVASRRRAAAGIALLLLGAALAAGSLAGRLDERADSAAQGRPPDGLTTDRPALVAHAPGADRDRGGGAAGSTSGASPGRLFVAGLRSGLLTFGGAYTVLPFLRHDAVVRGRWMTDEEFLDGVALSGMLPAPFIIFSTFVGYLGGGLAGALLLTAGIFLPAFGITLVGHQALERLINHRRTHTVLDGVTAGVVGLIAATALTLAREALTTPAAAAIFALALGLLYRWKARGAIAVIVLASGVLGLLIG